MAKTTNHPADCKVRAALEALQSDAPLAQLATKYEATSRHGPSGQPNEPKSAVRS